MTRRLKLLACVALLVTVSCSGPRTPLEVGVKEIDTDVLIGPRGTTLPSLPPSSSPPVGFPGIVQPPFPRFPTPEPTPTPIACPTASPLSSVERPATTTPESPPAANGYSFRNSGIYEIGDRSGPYPSRSTRLVRDVTRNDDGGFSFGVSIAQPDGSVTTTTYRVYPRTSDLTKPAAGLYIERVVTERDGERPTFVPTPSLLLVPFPASVGAVWDARGIDPLAQTLMEYSGTVTGRTIIDACGERLEAWRVELTAGRLRSPTSDLAFTASIDIAPQYGALSIADRVTLEGTDGGVRTKISNAARILEEPASS